MKTKIKYLLLFSWILISFESIFAQNETGDSLRQVIKSAVNDTVKLQALIKLSQLEKNNKEKYISNAKLAVNLAENIPEKKFRAKAWKNLADAYFYYDDFNHSLEYHIQRQKYFEENGNVLGIANSNVDIGKVYFAMGNFNKALELYNSSLTLFIKANKKSSIAACLTNIGILYHTQDKTDSAISYYSKAIKIYEEIGDKSNIANLLIGIGDIESSQGKYDNIEGYYSKAYQYFDDINEKNGSAMVLVAWGEVDIKRGLNSSAIEKLSRGYEIGKKAGSMRTMKNALEGLSTAYEKAGNYKLAFESGKQLAAIKDSILTTESLKQLNEVQGKFESEKKAKEIELLTQKDEKNKIIIYFVVFGLLLIAILAGVVYNRYTIKGRSTKIVEEKNKELERLSIVASETENVILIMDADGVLEWVNDSFVKLNAITLEELKKLKGETIFEISNNPHIRDIVEKSVRDKKPVEYESFNKTRDGKMVWESSTLTPIFDKSGKLKKLIIIDTDVTARKLAEEIVRQKNKDITDSINYAQKIQRAILPDAKEFRNYFPDSFVLFQPKDIVSGDFYWLSEKSGQVFFTAADCTGHGVPGGFMSMLGTSLLNEVVNEKNIYEPAAILDMLRLKIIHALKQKGESGESKDGMDMCLCRINKEKNELVFAAANNPLWLIRKNELLQFSANKQPVGIFGEENIDFTQQHISLESGDCVYIFTDGYADQFGGPKGKKFKYKQLKEIVMANYMLPMEEQKLLLERTFEEWKGNLEQIDDILIIGVRI